MGRKKKYVGPTSGSSTPGDSSEPQQQPKSSILMNNEVVMNVIVTQGANGGEKVSAPEATTEVPVAGDKNHLVNAQLKWKIFTAQSLI